MLQEVFAVMAILGMIVGSGFITGKEIVVFFSRFGSYSFLTIFLSFFIFFFAFKFILNYSKKISQKISKSKFAMFTNIILCTIFSSAMFGGINNLLNFDKKLINFVIFCVILLFCCLIFKKGGDFFNKLNLILVPLMLLVFVVLLCYKIKMPQLSFSNFGGISIFYCLLYCLLNISNGVVVIAGLGQSLSKKQKARVAFISALVLCIILLLTNIVLLNSPASFEEEMPMLTLFSYGGRIIMTFVIFVGCLTTLFSIIYSCSSSIRGICKNEYLNFSLSIILPLVLSLWGFSNIVQHLYPLASVMGGALLVQLFFIPPLKRGDKKIHSSRKNTKNKNACHDDI